MEKTSKKWEIELKLPKGRIRTFVYSDDGTNIAVSYTHLTLPTIYSV